MNDWARRPIAHYGEGRSKLSGRVILQLRRLWVMEPGITVKGLVHAEPAGEIVVAPMLPGSELTNYPAGGLIRFRLQKWDRIWGDYWRRQ